MVYNPLFQIRYQVPRAENDKILPDISFFLFNLILIAFKDRIKIKSMEKKNN